VPGLEQAERGAQVGGGDLHGLAGCAHRVVEPDPGIPQGVPQVSGQPLDVLAAVVQQDEVEVRPRRQLPATQRPDRDERGPVREPDRGGPRGEPEIVQVDQRRAQRLRTEPALARALLQQHGLRSGQVLRVPRRHGHGTHYASLLMAPSSMVALLRFTPE
jgi:hypothetical protein